MQLSNDDLSNGFAKRSVLDRHAVKAMGELLMLGAQLERHSRRVPERLGSLDLPGIFRRP